MIRDSVRWKEGFLTRQTPVVLLSRTGKGEKSRHADTAQPGVFIRRRCSTLAARAWHTALETVAEDEIVVDVRDFERADIRPNAEGAGMAGTALVVGGRAQVVAVIEGRTRGGERVRRGFAAVVLQHRQVRIVDDRVRRQQTARGADQGLYGKAWRAPTDEHRIVEYLAGVPSGNPIVDGYGRSVQTAGIAARLAIAACGIRAMRVIRGLTTGLV